MRMFSIKVEPIANGLLAQVNGIFTSAQFYFPDMEALKAGLAGLIDEVCKNDEAVERPTQMATT